MREPFTIEFGSVARTLEYEDAQGEVVFTFDIESANADRIVLEHHPRPLIDRPRYELAFGRCHDFLLRSGYSVAVYGDPSFFETSSPEQVRAQIAAAIEHLPITLVEFVTKIGSFVEPEVIDARSEPGNESWKVWRVFECTAPTATVVYEPVSHQFGVAQGFTFHGFWGNLGQTLRAISDA